MIICSCSSTQASTELSIDFLIRKGVTQVVRDGCQCDFDKSFISQGVLLCDQQQPNQFVYRANITSYGDYSANQLVGYIEDWVKQGATIASVVTVTFDPNCPVRISDISDPVCNRTSSSAISPSSISSTSAPNILAVLAASVAFLVIITGVTTLTVSTLIIYLHNKKKNM